MVEDGGADVGEVGIEGLEVCSDVFAVGPGVAGRGVGLGGVTAEVGSLTVVAHSEMMDIGMLVFSWFVSDAEEVQRKKKEKGEKKLNIVCL